MVRSIIINDDIAHNYFISRDDDGTYRLPIAIHPNKIHLPKTSQQVNEFVGSLTSRTGRTSLTVAGEIGKNTDLIH